MWNCSRGTGKTELNKSNKQGSSLKVVSFRPFKKYNISNLTTVCILKYHICKEAGENVKILMDFYYLRRKYSLTKRNTAGPGGAHLYSL